MLDRDLASLYETERRILNQTVKRNSKRFPKDFMFQLTREEYELLRLQFETLEKGESSRSQSVTLKTGRGRIRNTCHMSFRNYSPLKYLSDCMTSGRLFSILCSHSK